MRLLVFGGSVFLSGAVAAEAAARGHEVVAVNRGASGSIPSGVRQVRLDRAAASPGDLAALAAEIGPVDAVVDVARLPSWVRAAVAAFSQAHWVFVSTISVYAEPMAPGTDTSAPVQEPLESDVDLSVDIEAYGPMKVACERLVTAGAPTATVIRPGLIVGPGDPSGRYSYWPARLAEPGPVLAPDPDRPAQVIDVRDLAAWVVHCAEQHTVATLDGVGPVQLRRDLLAQTAAGVGTDPEIVWADARALAAHDVRPWAGDRSLPVWVPAPEDALMARDPGASVAAGLTCRPLAETARDTLAWLRSTPDAAMTGLTRAEEAEVLAALA